MQLLATRYQRFSPDRAVMYRVPYAEDEQKNSHFGMLLSYEKEVFNGIRKDQVQLSEQKKVKEEAISAF